MNLSLLQSEPSIILSVKISKAKNNTNYANLTVGNSEGTVKLTVWGVGSPNPFIVGKLVNMPKVIEKDGLIQTKSSDCAIYDCPANHPLQSLLPRVCSESDWTVLRDRILTRIYDYPKIQWAFVKHLFTVLYSGYSKYPAASQNHHAYPGGLLQHTYEVLRVMESLIDAVPYKFNIFITTVGCIFHDFYKMLEYSTDGQYQANMFLIGHSAGGAMILNRMMAEFSFEGEKFSEDIINHCVSAVLSHHGKLEWGAPILPCNIESFIVAKCDEISGHGIMYALAATGDKVNGTTIQNYE